MNLKMFSFFLRHENSFEVLPQQLVLCFLEVLFACWWSQPYRWQHAHKLKHVHKFKAWQTLPLLHIQYHR